MTNEEAIGKDKNYLFDGMMNLIRDEFDERDEAYNLGVYSCIDILIKFNFNNIASVLFDSIQENTKLKAENEEYKKALTTWNNANNEMLKFNQELKDDIELLKVENERLKENYETLSKQYCNVENSSIRYYNEMKKLKAELEQSVIQCKHGCSKMKNEIGETLIFCEYTDNWMNVMLGECLGNCESEE